MGTGGATALGSPECGIAPAVSLRSQRRKREAESLGTISSFQKNASFSGIYTQEFISAEDSRRYNRASFCFEIFWSPLFAIPLARDGLTEK